MTLMWTAILFTVSKMMWQLNIFAIFHEIGLIFVWLTFLNGFTINVGTTNTETGITKETHSNDSSDFMKMPITQDETNSSTYITNILAKARSKIKYETSNYNYTLSGVHGLEDLLMESGGQPLRTLIISSWRSGSTFLGDLVNAVPSTYYHYEPLIKYRNKQFREPQEAREPLYIVKQMFNCDFYGLKDYLEFQRKDFDRFNRPTILFDYCMGGNQNDLCVDEDFTSRLCKLFPFQSMKLVRLRLRLVEEILNDKELNVRVIVLVRDPRGVMLSRRRVDFCRLPDCSEHHLVCADMVSDYTAARQLLQKYPDRLMVMRFEDLILKPNITSDRILNFLKLDGRQVVDEFLQSHTTVEMPGYHSTFRVSRNVPFKWKTALDFSYVNDVQLACQEAMRVWGYKMAHNETHMTSDDFNPIGEYTI